MSIVIEQIRQALIDSIAPKALASSVRYHKPGEAPKVILSRKCLPI